MTGPEHYLEAERLLELAIEHQQSLVRPASVVFCHQAAQVHATLAIAGAYDELIRIQREYLELAREGNAIGNEHLALAQRNADHVCEAADTNQAALALIEELRHAAGLGPQDKS